MKSKKAVSIVKEKGKNITINSKSHELLKNFCKSKGYNLGAFCEIGALAKMQSEVTNSVL